MFYLGKVKYSFIILVLILYANSSFAVVTNYQLDLESDEEQQSSFIAGQVWSYKTRQHEQNSKLTILKVDYFESAVVVHIRLDNVAVMDPGVSKGVRTVVSHMAFMQTALQSSVVKLLDKNRRLPEFSKEYQQWREGDGVGTAWAWHFSVSKALKGLEKLYTNEHQSSAIKNSEKNNN
ncbi:MAG: hypothetical protein ACC653_06695 [Gammaproteobacteria bacterium]